MHAEVRELKEAVQSSHINFLIGAGASRPYLPLLGDIETRLRESSNKEQRTEQLRRYFNEVMMPCAYIIKDGSGLSRSQKRYYDQTISNYHSFFEATNSLLLKRKNTLLAKQCNIFTTNIDVFMEKALEDLKIDYNDGFSGLIKPIFQTGNFSKSIYKTSSHFDNRAEIPNFNIVKLHGSLSWKLDNSEDEITHSNLSGLRKIADASSDLAFSRLYSRLQIVNPTNLKFEKTVLEVIYYELLRRYSSELEKENCVLFVVGFSMEDEHIREITVRALNSNPTLMIYIFSHSKRISPRYSTLLDGLKYKNLKVLSPEQGERYDLSYVSKSVIEKIQQ